LSGSSSVISHDLADLVQEQVEDRRYPVEFICGEIVF